MTSSGAAASIVVLLLFVFVGDAIGKVATENPLIWSKMSAALGSQSIAVHFGMNSAMSLIDHARGRPHSGPRDHLACVPYASFAHVLHTLQHDFNLVGAVTYSSPQRGLACFHLSLTKVQAEVLRESATLEWSFLEPMPSAWKLDSSIFQFQDHLMQVLLPDHRARTDIVAHPSVRRYTSGDATGLGVVFRHKLSASERSVIKTDWQSVFPSSSPMTALLDSSEQLGLLSRSPSPYLSSSIHKALAQEHLLHAHFNRFHSFITREQQQTDSHSLCDFSQLLISIYTRGAFVRFATEQQSDLDSPVDEQRRHRHALICLSHVANTLALDERVARVALSHPIEPQNSIARGIVQSASRSGSEPFSSIKLTGKGVVIGLADTGIDEMHCFFRDDRLGQVPRVFPPSTSPTASPSFQAGNGKPGAPHRYFNTSYRKVIQYVDYSGSEGDYVDGHGSHVAGTLAGSCVDSKNSKNTFHGMATGAKIAFFDMGKNSKQIDLVLPDDLDVDMFSVAHEAGARIHSDSWGGGFFYDALSIASDEFLTTHDDSILVFAAGNGGAAGSHTVLSPAISKNGIAVAASNNAHVSSLNIDHLAVFSAHGPTLDGRLKPDIAAPGNSITSAKAASENTAHTSSSSGTCETEAKSGTSMATPVIAGHAALLLEYCQSPAFFAAYCNRQYAKCQRGAFSPTGYLLKAMILHSGQALSEYDGKGTAEGVVMLSSTPDSYQGYGRMNLQRLLPVSTQSLDLYLDDEDALSSLQEQAYTVTVTHATTPLRVTLCWYDPLNSAFAAKLLLHDLDLVVEDPQGTVFLGNAMIVNGQQVFGASRDELNTNEQVLIAVPKAGKYIVRVQSKAITQSNQQSYAIVITSHYTSHVEKHSSKSDLPLSLLEACATHSAASSLLPVAIGLTKFARAAQKGWNANDYYLINATTGGELQIMGYFRDKVEYAVDDVCLFPGEYALSLSVSSATQAAKGTLLSVPQCDNLWLSPLSPKASLSVLSRSLNDLLVPNQTTCHSQCMQRIHQQLDLTLLDAEGVGWLGAYYAILPDHSHDWQTANFDEQQETVVSGSMTWGFEEIASICVPPMQTTCNRVQLLLPQADSDTDNPQLIFSHAKLVVHNDSQLYINGDCPFALNISNTIAEYCRHESLSHDWLASWTLSGNTLEESDELVMVTFYSTPIPSTTLAQSALSIADFWRSVSTLDSAAIGQCLMPLRLMAGTEQPIPTAAPSVLPSIAPSVQPSLGPGETYAPTFSFAPTPVPSVSPTASPTMKPTLTPTRNPTQRPTNYWDFGDSAVNVSCLRNCSSFPGELELHTNLAAVCVILTQDVFGDCDSFSLSSRLCTPKECASSCDAHTLCTLSAGLDTNCPGSDDGNSGGSQIWTGPESNLQAKEIQQSCLKSWSAMDVASSTTDQSIPMGFTTPTWTLLAVILLLTAVLSCVVLAKYGQVTANPGLMPIPLDDDSIHRVHAEELADEQHEHEHGFDYSDDEAEVPDKSLTATLRQNADRVMQSVASVSEKIRKKTRASGSAQGEYEMIGRTAFSEPRFTIVDEEAHDDDDDHEQVIAFHNPMASGRQ